MCMWSIANAGVVDAHTTQEVKSEGDTVEATEVADAEIFTKLPAHQLSDKGVYVVCMYVYM